MSDRNGVAVILTNSDGGVWVSQRTNTDTSRGMWQFAGGKIEDNESPPAAALREVLEETGLDLSTTGLYALNSVTRHLMLGTNRPYTMEWFYADIGEQVPRNLEPEKHSDWKLVSEADIETVSMTPGSKEAYILYKNMKFIPTVIQIQLAQYSHRRWIANHFHGMCYSAYDWAVMCIQNEYATNSKVCW